MKKVSLIVTASLFATAVFTNCGGSKEKDEMSDLSAKTDSIMAAGIAAEGSESSTESLNTEINLDEINSADEAMSQYKDLIEKYAEVSKSGKLEDAKEIKKQMDKLKSFSEGKWKGASLKAMADLSKMALQIEAGKEVDLGDALKAYDKAMDAVKDLPGSEDAKELLKTSGDALKAAGDLKGMSIPE